MLLAVPHTGNKSVITKDVYRNNITKTRSDVYNKKITKKENAKWQHQQ